MNQAQLIAKRADHKTSHLLHLVLSIITAGLWIPVWILVAVIHSLGRGGIDRKLNSGEPDGGVLGLIDKWNKHPGGRRGQ